MNKGFLAALCLVVLLFVPACCWRKPCSPCEKPCAPRVCERPKNDCVETECETYIEPVKAEREVTITTIKKKHCGTPTIEACCDDMNGGAVVKKSGKRNSRMD